jgi:hypothetical protein
MSETRLARRLALERELLAIAQQLTELELLLQDYYTEREQLLTQARAARAQLEQLSFGPAPTPGVEHVD